MKQLFFFSFLKLTNELNSIISRSLNDENSLKKVAEYKQVKTRIDLYEYKFTNLKTRLLQILKIVFSTK